MKRELGLLAFLALLASAGAATTINSTNPYAYSANTGWVNAKGDTANGAVIGEYVCAGHLWGANVGWIHLGSGAPADGIRYSNQSGDFGVNHDGQGNLRGYAYGANIGWLNFESNGAPRVDLMTGRLGGSVWSANCGWISLSNAFAFVQTDTIRPGTDTDHDGISDAWELSHVHNLMDFTGTSDSDGDGVLDREEYMADTDPLDDQDFLHITEYSMSADAGQEESTLTWTVSPTRLYQVDYRTNLGAGIAWASASSRLSPDPGGDMTRLFLFTPVLPERYFRVQAIRPLSP